MRSCSHSSSRASEPARHQRGAIVHAPKRRWYAPQMAKKRAPQHPLEDNPFVEDFLDWMHSPEGEESDEAREAVWSMLESADVGAKQRKIIWEDGKSLTIAESVQRIHVARPDLSLDLIEAKVISWLEVGFSPEHYSQKKLDELDRLLGPWLDEHQASR